MYDGYYVFIIIVEFAESLDVYHVAFQNIHHIIHRVGVVRDTPPEWPVNCESIMIL